MAREYSSKSIGILEYSTQQLDCLLGGLVVAWAWLFLWIYSGRSTMTRLGASE